MLQLWGEFVFQEHSGDAHANTPEGGAIQLQRHTHVIDRRRVVHESELLTETGVFHPLESRPVGNPLTDEIGIGVKNCIVFGVDDGSVVDHGPTTDHGLKKVVEVAVGSEVVGNSPANRLRITCIYTSAAQIRSCFSG